MRRALHIALREYASFFAVPVGWVVIALFLLLSGLVFGLLTLRPGEPASMRDFFSLSAFLLVFIAPAVSMRLLAEEIRTGSMESLDASPVPTWAIVLGKHLGATMFLATVFAPTLVYVAVLAAMSSPDYGAIASGYLGLLLLGALYLAVGTLFSASTSSQVVAFLTTLFVLALAQFATRWGASMLGPPYDRPLFALSLELRMADFAKGVLDTAHIAFFLVLTAWLLACAAAALGARRWR